MTDVERFWFRNDLLDEGVAYRYTESEEDERDLFPPPAATVAEALADFWDEIATVDVILEATHSISVLLAARRYAALVHAIEEYARHCGHADLLREAIDGTTGE